MHADDMPRRQSYLDWYLSSIGTPMLLLIVGASLLTLVLIIMLFVRGRGPAVPAAILFVLPFPLLIGALCLVGGSIKALSQLARPVDPQGSTDWFSFGLNSMMQASSCFCPMLLLSLTFLMILGFRNSAKPH